jgi:hypothetical protein
MPIGARDPEGTQRVATRVDWRAERTTERLRDAMVDEVDDKRSKADLHFSTLPETSPPPAGS